MALPPKKPKVVTVALRKRLARRTTRAQAPADLPQRLMALAGRLRVAYDTHPITTQEWADTAGDGE